VFIDLPPQVSGLSQLDHWQGNRNGRNRTCDASLYIALPLSYIPNNPDSRVSKVFNVSCLPRVVSGACPPIYLLQGGAYCLYDRIDSNDTCRKLHPLFNLQIPPEPVSVKDTHQRKEESMKKMFMSSGCNHLRIFPMNTFYHRTFKKLWYMF